MDYCVCVCQLISDAIRSASLIANSDSAAQYVSDRHISDPTFGLNAFSHSNSSFIVSFFLFTALVIYYILNRERRGHNRPACSE